MIALFDLFRSNEKNMEQLAEQLESVAYVICGEDLITFDKFCQIWHVKGVSGGDGFTGVVRQPDSEKGN